MLYMLLVFQILRGALTEGKGLRDAMKMAADTLASRLYNRTTLPKPTRVEDLKNCGRWEFILLKFRPI